MLSDNCCKEITILRIKLGGVLAMRECLWLCFLWIMTWAAATVVLRAAFRIDRWALLWGFFGLAAAAVAGLILAVQKLPTAAATRAALDRHGRLGGLLMADGDADIGQWRQRMSLATMPALRWRAGRQCMQLSAAAAFLTAAFLAPDRYLPSERETVLQIGGEVRKLTENIQLLKQEQILPMERAEALEKDLDRIRRDALGKDPAKTMEAVDHLEQSLNKAADDAAESAIKQTETAAQAQALAEALQTARDQMDPKQLGEAMKGLTQMAQQAAAESKLLSDSLADDLKDAMQNGALTDAQLQELSRCLKTCKAGQRAKLMKLVKAKLIDEAELIDCDKACDCDEAALVDALCKCDKGRDLAAALASCKMAGRGGPGGGGPAAVMTWSKGTDQQGAAFKEKVLPPAAMSSLKESRLAGISAGDPTSKKPAGGSSGGVLDAARAGGGEARTQIILPEHEKTVQRYFSREKK